MHFDRIQTSFSQLFLKVSNLVLLILHQKAEVLEVLLHLPPILFSTEFSGAILGSCLGPHFQEQALT